MRLLIVGLGSMGKRRARLLHRIDPAFHIAGVDSSPQRCEQAKELGIAAFDSLQAALSAGAYDAAFVCTAPLSHAGITRQLLCAGVSVFSEINLVSDGYDELVALAEQKGLTLFLSSTMLYRSEIGYIHDRVKSFDKPLNYSYHIGQYLPDWHPWEAYQNFFVGDARTSGVREILGIELPWLFSTFGAAEAMFVHKKRLSTLNIAYEDSCFVALKHESGATGYLTADVVCPKAVRNLEVFGEGMHLFWEGSPHSLYDFDTDTKQKRQIELYADAEQNSQYSDNIVENAYTDELLNFFDVLSKKAAPKWDFSRDAEVITLMDAIEANGGKDNV